MLSTKPIKQSNVNAAKVSLRAGISFLTISAILATIVYRGNDPYHVMVFFAAIGTLVTISGLVLRYQSTD